MAYGLRLRRMGWGAGITAGIALTGLAGLHSAPAAPKAEVTVGSKIADVKLPDTTGKVRSLSEFQKQKALVLVFVGTECPISNSYAELLSQLDAKFRPRGVQLLGVNSVLTEDQAAVAKHAKEFRLSFPVLKDTKQTLADAVGARVTPEAFVLDAGRVIRYRGRIDNIYASRTRKRNEASSRDLETAVDAVLSGKPVAVATTQAFGCSIARPELASSRAAAITYYKDIAPILQDRCQTCHRPNQVAPFSLLTAADAKSWASEIKQFTQNRQMPPWKAEPGHGEFEDVRRMSDADISTISKWVDAGAPEGDPKTGPAAKQWSDEWMLGKPDLVLKMAEPYQVAASGPDDFRCFVLPTNLTEDKQVVGIELRPGNARVVHHVINFLDQNGQARALDARDPAQGYNSGPGGIGFFPTGALGGWAPGNFPRWLPKGVGMTLPKGSDVVMQLHYHKTGKPEVDQTSVGIYFAKEPVEKELQTLPVTSLNIRIPPNEARHEVKASWPIPFDAHALTVTPHMHLLGKEMKVTYTLPDGTEKDLIWIKDWDYRWQDTYRFKEPVAIPKGSKVNMVAYFDNTTSNPLNPSNPPKEVRFGEQTTDEMCFAFLGFTSDKPQPAFNLGRLFGGAARGGGLFGK